MQNPRSQLDPDLVAPTRDGVWQAHSSNELPRQIPTPPAFIETKDPVLLRIGESQTALATQSAAHEGSGLALHQIDAISTCVEAKIPIQTKLLFTSEDVNAWHQLRLPPYEIEMLALVRRPAQRMMSLSQ